MNRSKSSLKNHISILGSFSSLSYAGVHCCILGIHTFIFFSLLSVMFQRSWLWLGISCHCFLLLCLFGADQALTYSSLGVNGCLGNLWRTYKKIDLRQTAEGSLFIWWLLKPWWKGTMFDDRLQSSWSLAWGSGGSCTFSVASIFKFTMQTLNICQKWKPIRQQLFRKSWKPVCQTSTNLLICCIIKEL